MEMLTSLVRELSLGCYRSGDKIKENAVGTPQVALMVVNICCHAAFSGVHSFTDICAVSCDAVKSQN